jgi:hypothetical protein
MSAPMIPRKEIARKEVPQRAVEEPSPAHLKETGTGNAATTWDVPEERQKERKLALFGASAGTGDGWALSDRFDRIVPPHKRYLGRSRRTFLIMLLVAFVCLLVLMFGYISLQSI